MGKVHGSLARAGKVKVCCLFAIYVRKCFENRTLLTKMVVSNSQGIPPLSPHPGLNDFSRRTPSLRQFYKSSQIHPQPNSKASCVSAIRADDMESDRLSRKRRRRHQREGPRRGKPSPRYQFDMVLTVENRITYTRRFVNVTMTGGKRKVRLCWWLSTCRRSRLCGWTDGWMDWWSLC